MPLAQIKRKVTLKISKMRILSGEDNKIQQIRNHKTIPSMKLTAKATETLGLVRRFG